VESGGVLDELAALEQELADLREQEESDSSALAALEAEASKRRDQLETIRDARDEHEQRVEEIRRKLRVADEASEACERNVVARDSVAQSVTEAIDRLLEELAELDRAQEEAEGAWVTAEARAREAGRPSPARPRDIGTDTTLRDAWERLRTEIRTRSHEQFEDDLVDAAVHSPMGHAINDLPTHLRELARQRRSHLIQKLG
jgi:chromosome segregation ATPase